MFASFIATVRKRLADRRSYNLMLAEIESLNQRDLVDMGADRTELQRGAWKQIYG